MDAPRFGIDLLLKSVGVGALELCELTPVEHQPGAFYPLAGEALELVDVGRILPALALASALQAEAAVEDLAELLRRSDREGTAGGLVDLLLERLDVPPELGREARKIFAVDLDSAAFHPADHGYERLVDPFVDSSDVLGCKPRSQPKPEPQRDVRIL